MTEISFEFFPPKTDKGREKLESIRKKLAEFSPEYFSVTYGAGGSTRNNTKDIVLGIRGDGQDVAPHLSFGADSKETIRDLLQIYNDNGISRLVALRGDLPSGMGAIAPVYASELVAFVRTEFGDAFEIAVACYPEVHPQASSFQADIDFLKRKLDAGADYAISQYFYNVEAFFYFMDACQKAGIDKPIYPGVMPITNAESLIRFSDACGADIPRWIRKALADRPDPAQISAFGEEVVTELCRQLLEFGVPGFHFYTMNQFEPSAQLCRNLGLSATD